MHRHTSRPGETKGVQDVCRAEKAAIRSQRDRHGHAFGTPVNRGREEIAVRFDFRTVRKRRKDRIDAYTTVLYTTYLLWSWAERTLRDKFPDMTLQQALNSLSDVSIVSFQSNKSTHRWTTRLTDEQKKLLNLFGAAKYLHVA